MLLLSVYQLKAGLRMEFEALGTEAGLAVNYVVSIAQLKDNRIVAVTMDDVNIWDGHSFQRIRKSREEFTPIPGYQGHYHTYVDKNGEVWIKDYGCLWHYDKHWRLVHRPLTPGCDDVFIDDNGNIYFIRQNRNNPILDLKVVRGKKFLFYSDGSMRCYSVNNNQPLYKIQLPMSDSLAVSSLVVTDRKRGRFYQLLDQRYCMMFDIASRQWSEIFRSERLHTIALIDSSTALITSYGGMWKINLENTKAEYIGQIQLTDGNYISSSRLNTVFRDREGTLWLGSYDRGLLKSCPQKPWTATLPAVICGAGLTLFFVVWLSFRIHKARKRKSYPTNSQSTEFIRKEPTTMTLPETSQRKRAEKERKPGNDQAGKHEDLIAKAMVMVQRNMGNQDYSVEKLAQDLCMDRTGLYKKMKAATGLSPLEFIRDIRLNHASALMKEGKHSMAEIASMTGMGSARHLARCFQASRKKREAGQRPKREE